MTYESEYNVNALFAFSTSSSFVLAAKECSDEFHLTSFSRTKLRTFSEEGFVGDIGISRTTLISCTA